MEEQKKEIQKIIFPLNNKKVGEDEFLNILKLVAPGTNFRSALDGVLKTGKGGLIILDNEHITPLIDGGFRLNCIFTPQRLIELSKMDGAIILSKDMKRINFANVLLTPDTQIKSSETGTRHKAAERTAKQINCLTIAISERKHEITLFYKDIKYKLKATEEILRKTIAYIQLLEKQRELFDISVKRLDKMEFKVHDNISIPVQTIQKGIMVKKLSNDLKKDMTEIGIEGSLLKARLKELVQGVEKETSLVIKDYTKIDFKKSKILIESLNYDELIDPKGIIKALDYEDSSHNVKKISGWRILSRTNLTDKEIAMLIKKFGTLEEILKCSLTQFDSIEEIRDKAVLFYNELEKLKSGL